MIKKEDPYFKYLIISMAFHLAIFLVLTVKILFFPSELQEHKQAVRIDVVALPEKQIEQPKPVTQKKPEPVKKKPEPPKPKPKPKKVVKKKPPPKPKPKKVALKKKKETKKIKEEQNSAIARLKALQKIKNKEKEQEQPKEFKGNQISKGNSLSGMAKLHHDSYLDELDNHVRSFWNLPEWLANGNLKARVLLQINKNGGINSKSFLSKSGNDLFDQHVMGTLEKASPFPAPPSSLIDFYATKGVELRFPE